ncbi:zinc transport system substrate-binding protein [Thermomonospora echinospora]|uniref:Zinc transport system substrate-binding protein n=1 Tax=Thermomonospora echinospora TaxID=1992 RepID=A0A1H6DMH6_9ACTN|nr:metal ABC transporter substrate-binding protein [Thermomonospora echinospora]SEG86438.1 zinc transport system substrate-binding protein [Thermomonospora echinospora]
MFPFGTPLRAFPVTTLAVAGLLGLTACGSSDGTTATPGGDSGGGDTKVIASLYPVAWLAQKVGGRDVSVTTLTRPGAEPHGLELTPRQIADIGAAKFTIYVKGMQPAVDEAVDQHAKGKSLDAASVVKTLPSPAGADGHDHGEEEHDHGEEEHGHEDEVSYDPHVWLDPNRMATIATALGDKFAATDSAHATGYRERARSVAAELNALDQSYRNGLRACKRDTVVTAHAAFQYMVDRYGLKQISIAGIDPGSEPSPARLAELTKEIKAAGATTVFTETLVSPKVAETLAKESGVSTAVLDPVEGVQEGASDDYISIMRKNLETLRPALECS